MNLRLKVLMKYFPFLYSENLYLYYLAYLGYLKLKEFFNTLFLNKNFIVQDLLIRCSGNILPMKFVLLYFVFPQ